MRCQNCGLIIGSLLTVFVGVLLLSCAANKAPTQVQNSLPQNELTYYNDSFDNMREDLWDRAGYLYRKEQVQNFKQADMRFENGKLIMRTRTGSFCKGGLASRYVLRGDFDIRLDCRMDFIKGVSGMDQVFAFGVLDKSKKIGDMNSANIGLSIREASYQGYIFSSCIISGKRQRGKSQKIENFNGTFRILRSGKTIRSLFKPAGIPGWSQLNAFDVTDHDMVVGFQVRNFVYRRTAIRAKHPITVEIDRLTIFSAQQIIEDEI
jgi:hypothetical protein